MGGPGSGRIPTTHERRVSSRTETQEKNLYRFLQYMEEEYPKDEHIPKRNRARFLLDSAFETAIEMGKRAAGSPPSMKGFEALLPYLIGVPQQGVLIETKGPSDASARVREFATALAFTRKEVTGTTQ